MADVTRLKQQNRGFRWIDLRTVEYVLLCRTDEGNVGLDVVEAAGLIAEVLPLILNDGEAVPHGLHPPAPGEKMAPPCARRQSNSCELPGRLTRGPSIVRCRGLC